MIGLTVKSLDEVPECLRGICIEEGGVISLDETYLRTKSDLDAMSEAKRKEVNDHKATKAALAAWRTLGDDPDAVAERISDLEARAGSGDSNTEKLANLLRENRKVIQERDALKTELDGIKPKFEAQEKLIRETRTSEVLKKLTGNLKGVDTERLCKVLAKDVALGFIQLDESEEGLTVKTGETFDAYAMSQAETFNMKLRNTPGGSNPGSDGSRTKNNFNAGFPAVDGLLDDDLVGVLDS